MFNVMSNNNKKDKKKKKRAPITFATSFMVIAFAVVLAVSMIVQAVLNYLPSIAEITHKPWLVKFLNNDLEMPITELSFLWISIVAAYVGIDRAAYAAKTFTLSYGEQDVGDPQTIRRIILISGLLYLEAVILNSIVKGDYSLGNLATAFGSTVLLYVAGQKVTKIGQFHDGEKDHDEVEEETYAQNDDDSDDDENLREQARREEEKLVKMGESLTRNEDK